MWVNGRICIRCIGTTRGVHGSTPVEVRRYPYPRAAYITAFGYAATETITEFHVFAVVLCAAAARLRISTEAIIHE